MLYQVYVSDSVEGHMFKVCTHNIYNSYMVFIYIFLYINHSLLSQLINLEYRRWVVIKPTKV